MYTLNFPNEDTLRIIRHFNKHYSECRDKDTFSLMEAQATCSEDVHEESIKYSAFNDWEHRDNVHVVFNSLYNTLSVFSNEAYREFNNLDKADKELKNRWYSLGLCVNSDLDEITSYLQYAYAARKWKSRKLRLVITTTMCCNARCAYCYEADVQKRGFDKSVKEDLLKFIELQCTEEGVGITWFGGEPLLNTDLIDYVTDYLIKKDIEYSAYIITNGRLLTKDMLINKFPHWHIGAMQITIDGTKDNYLKIKNYYNTNTDYFEKLIENIKIADEAGIGVDIRLNIDQDNMQDIFTLACFLEEQFSNCSKVSMYPAFIAGTNKVIAESERINLIKQLIKHLKNPDKATFLSKLHKEARIAPCNIADHRSFGIDVDGCLHTCEHYVGKKEYAIGDVAEGVRGKDRRLEDFNLEVKCKQCVWLPQCFGGCQAHRIEGDIPCMIEKYMIPAYIQYLADYIEEEESKPIF